MNIFNIYKRNVGFAPEAPGNRRDFSVKRWASQRWCLSVSVCVCMTRMYEAEIKEKFSTFSSPGPPKYAYLGHVSGERRWDKKRGGVGGRGWMSTVERLNFGPKG